jgi:hypothetical protein
MLITYKCNGTLTLTFSQRERESHFPFRRKIGMRVGSEKSLS